MKNIKTNSGSFLVSPTSLTIYKITNLIDSNACALDIAAQVSDTMKVNQLPIANFVYAGVHCEKNDILFTNQSTANLDQVVKWNWDMGNGTQLNLMNGDPFNQQYPNWGKVTVKLWVASSLGCKSDTLVKVIEVKPLPVVGFTIPNVCLDGGRAVFKDQGNGQQNQDNKDSVPPRYKQFPFGAQLDSLLHPCGKQTFRRYQESNSCDQQNGESSGQNQCGQVLRPKISVANVVDTLGKVGNQGQGAVGGENQSGENGEAQKVSALNREDVVDGGLCSFKTSGRQHVLEQRKELLLKTFYRNERYQRKNEDYTRKQSHKERERNRSRTAGYGSLGQCTVKKGTQIPQT